MSETYYFENATIQLVLNNCRGHILIQTFKQDLVVNWIIFVKSNLYLSIGLFHICQIYSTILLNIVGIFYGNCWGAEQNTKYKIQNTKYKIQKYKNTTLKKECRHSLVCCIFFLVPCLCDPYLTEVIVNIMLSEFPFKLRSNSMDFGFGFPWPWNPLPFVQN